VPLAGESGSGRSLRPWGWFETLARGEGYLVKRLCLHAGSRISLQRHRHRCEHWVVVRGEGTVACEGRQWRVGPGDSAFIPLGAMHRATAGDAELELIEVQRGELLSEEDIERFADDFGRVVNFGVTL
jgi:mannose-6-phosphate isomerase-like protein (cupin superfamily)